MNLIHRSYLGNLRPHLAQMIAAIKLNSPTTLGIQTQDTACKSGLTSQSLSSSSSFPSLVVFGMGVGNFIFPFPQRAEYAICIHGSSNMHGSRDFRVIIFQFDSVAAKRSVNGQCFRRYICRNRISGEIRVSEAFRI